LEVTVASHNATPKLLRSSLASLTLAAVGIYQVCLGLYFIILRPSFLPEDARFAAVDPSVLRTVAPHIEAWLDLVFTVAGGQMSAVGVLLLASAWTMHRRQTLGAFEIAAFGIAGVLSVAFMSAVNFALGSDFRWPLLVPVLLWIAAMLGMVHQARAMNGS
jgi:hypothetical protein